MASTASDSPASSPAAASAFLDDHPLFLDPTTTNFFPTAAAATTSRKDPLPPPAPASPSAAAPRKPPRKRPRASRRPPTTVLTTDTSNFRAMVQEFTGIPAPPPFAPHLAGGPSGVLFGVPHHHHDPARAPLELLMRPSPIKLPAAAAAAAHHPSGSFAHSSLFPNSNLNPAGSTTSSEFYSGFAPPSLSGGGGFEAAEDERVGHGHNHGLFSSLLHAGDRYHSH